MSYIGKKNGNPNTDFLEAGGELENHDLVNVDSSGRIITPTVNRTSTDGNVITIAKDGTTVGSIGAKSNRLFIGNGDTGFYFVPDGDAVYPWNVSSNANRDAAINLGQISNRFKDLYLSGGVYVGGTGSANYLDDYEEGTFTPTFTSDGGTNPTMAYYYNNGRYTKVGNLVTVILEIITESRSGGSGNLIVSGLPFTVNSYDTRNGAAIGFNFSWNTGSPKYANSTHGISYIRLWRDAPSNTKSDVADIKTSGNSYLSLSMSYLTT